MGKHTTMSKALVYTLLVALVICLAKGNFIGKRDASQALSSKKAKWVTLSKNWDTVCDFNSVEAWSEYQDELEETNLPEPEVENLEKCVKACYWSDQAKDFAGRAYEEMREDQEENETVFVPACRQCFDAIPKSMSSRDRTKSMNCENKETHK